MLAAKWKGQLGSSVQDIMALVSGAVPPLAWLLSSEGLHCSGALPLQLPAKGPGKLRFRSTPAALARELAAKPSGFMVGIRNCNSHEQVQLAAHTHQPQITVSTTVSSE